ncbi:hypothetical protein ACIQU6_40345 [Streptomyces sp. NPDC090442]|uniref:hypothetical protein n=1 Tax=Streptomyces sp. NPDC090442 TaxID=3365962 RepID=UPI0037F5BDD7
MTAVWLHMPVTLTVGDHTGNLGTLTIGPGDSVGPRLAGMLRDVAAACEATTAEGGGNDGTP